MKFASVPGWPEAVVRPRLLVINERESRSPLPRHAKPNAFKKSRRENALTQTPLVPTF